MPAYIRCEYEDIFAVSGSLRTPFLRVLPTPIVRVLINANRKPLHQPIERALTQADRKSPYKRRS